MKCSPSRILPLILLTLAALAAPRGIAFAATNVYYSVGQSSSDLKTGSPTVSIASGVATFSVAQTGNIGVGDAVTYGGVTGYVSGKISTTQWSLITAQGASSTATTSASVTSIKRAFTTLYNAVRFAYQPSYANTSDLVASNIIINIPCYYDSGPDYTPVYLSTAAFNHVYATGPGNYFNIYTPTSTSSEANFSQRHLGKWTANAFTMSSGGTDLVIGANYARITGLQFTSTSSTLYASIIQVATTSASNVVFSDNIVWDQTTQYSVDVDFGAAATQPTGVMVNNVIFRTASQNGIAARFYGNDAVYNNTVSGFNTGYISSTLASGGFVNDVTYKNDMAQNSTYGFGNSSATIDPSSAYNVSNASDAPGTNPQNGKSASFINASAGDYHLSIADSAARDKGTDLSADATYPFSVDIDNQSRPYNAVWDIGADEWMPGSSSPSVTFALPSSLSSALALLSPGSVSTSSTSGVPIVEYLITNSPATPAASNPGWSASLPSSYVFGGTGLSTAYAWVMDAYGNVASSSATTTISGTFSPSGLGSAIPATYFGLHEDPRASPGYPEGSLLNWPSVPFGAIRIWESEFTGWTAVEPQRGAFVWSAIDDHLEKAHAGGEDVMYTMAFTPAWASSQPNSYCNGAFGNAACDPPSDVSSGDTYWKEFVTALVQHSLANPKHYIKYYEIWNEPGGGATGYYYHGTPGQLAIMAHDAYAIVHSLDPNAVVVSPSPTSPDGPGEQWLASYYASSTALGYSAASLQDVVAYHTYVGTNPLYVASSTAAFQAVMNAAGIGSLPLFSTEGDWGASNLTDADASAYVPKYFLTGWTSGLSRMYWFIWDGDSSGLDQWGLLWSPGRGVYPAGFAYAKTYNWLKGSYVSSGSCTQTLDGAYHCNIVLSNGNPAQILWNDSVGTTSTQSLAVSPSFTSYETLDDTLQHPIVGNAVNVSSKPILLIANAYSAAVANPAASSLPKVTGFSAPSAATYPLSSANGATVPISVFDALSQYSTTTGYMVTESSAQPAPSDSRWTISPPYSFTFSSGGTAKTMYPWTKDAYGNVSSAANAVAQSQTVALSQAAPVNVYYSVGQSSANLMTGSPTVTVSGLTATFSVPQTGNIGVGDQVVYNSGSIAYISGKLSKTQWTLVSATGTAPAAASGASVLSITHAFNSLSSAFISGFGDSAHLNSYSLSASNAILNIPAYYDSGPDAGAANVPSFGTGPSNYVNIYTPVDTQREANFSQRHAGAWSNAAFQILATSSSLSAIDLGGANYARITGLEFTDNTNAAYPRVIRMDGITGTNGAVMISDNIMRNLTSNANAFMIGNGSTVPNLSIYATNNVIYATSKTGAAIFTYGGSLYASDNTMYGNNVGIQISGTATGVLKNNVSQNNGFAGYYSGSSSFDASSANNLSDRADAPGSNPQNSKTVAFSNVAAGDFHLAATDTAAIGHGVSLFSDANYQFGDDVDGQSRPYSAAWDLGADQYLAPASSTISLLAGSTSVSQGASLALGALGISNAPGISSVQFFLDGSPVGSAMPWNHGLPLSYVFSTNSLAAGAHAITAQETDYSGSTNLSAPAILTVIANAVGNVINILGNARLFGGTTIK